jgi:hypothetical protein
VFSKKKNFSERPQAEIQIDAGRDYTSNNSSSNEQSSLE